MDKNHDKKNEIITSSVPNIIDEDLEMSSKSNFNKDNLETSINQIGLETNQGKKSEFKCNPNFLFAPSKEFSSVTCNLTMKNQGSFSSSNV